MRLSIHTQHIELTPELRDYVQTRLRMSLSRWGGRITRVAAHLRDENGPRGGIAERCLLRARVGRRDLVICRTSSDIHAAVNDACDRLADAAQRAIARERLSA
jgi:ribosomal subunit interface protein